MGWIQEYMEGVAMRKNPQLLQQRLQNMDAEAMRSTVDSLYGQAATPQEVAPFEQDMFPGEAPIQGLETITQEAQAGSGLLGSAQSPEEARYLQAQKVLGMSGNREGLGQQANLLSNMQNSIMSGKNQRGKGKGSWTTFEIGAPGGQKQRAYFDEQGQMVPIGDPYRAHAPQMPSTFQEKMSALGSPDPAVRARAKEAMRNQWVQTDTGSVNAATGEVIDKNLIEGKVQSGYGESVSQQLEGYNDYVKASESSEYGLDKTLQDLDSLDAMTNNWTTGVGGTLLSYIPQTDATDWDAAKTTVVSQLGLEKLRDLKASSPTGASGFGALSEKELRLLTSHVASLEQAQSPQAIKRAIVRIKNHLSRVKGDIQKDRKRSAEWYKRNAENQNINRGGRYDQEEGPAPGLKWK